MGSKPGERRGGRKKGTPNKATAERERRALEELRGKAQLLNRALAKDELDDLVPEVKELMQVVKGSVAHFQRAAFLGGTGLPGQSGYVAAAWDKLREWIILLKDVQVAAAVIMAKSADFQSPKYKAIAVMTPPPEMPREDHGGKVIEINDPQALARVYQRMLLASGR